MFVGNIQGHKSNFDKKSVIVYLQLEVRRGVMCETEEEQNATYNVFVLVTSSLGPAEGQVPWDSEGTARAVGSRYHALGSRSTGSHGGPLRLC